MSFVFIGVGLLGGWWLFKLSEEHHAEASFLYGFLGTAWAFACLAIAANLVFK